MYNQIRFIMKMKRHLGFWSTFCIAAGAMISSGLFVLPGAAFSIAGPAVVLAYALAALMVIPALLSKVELATAMPKSGGSYFFIERSMGPLAGTLAGLANWLSIALKSAFAMIGIGAFAQLIWPETDIPWQWVVKGVAAACCVGFTIMNLMSVKLTGRTQIVLVLALLVVMGVFVVAGFPNIRQHPNFDNFFKEGFWSMFATAGLVFVSFGGLTKVASVAEEIRHPGRNIPAAMFAAFVVVSLFYVAAVGILVGVLPGEQIASGDYVNLTPLSTAAGEFLGHIGVVLLSVAAMLAFITTGNGGILAASRSPLAMSRDGLLPGVFRNVSARRGTPYVSVLVTGVFMTAMILLLKIVDLIKVASTMMLILFLLVNVAVLIMRSSRIQNYRPLYRSPLFPWMQLAGVGLYGMLIFQLIAMLGLAPLITTGGFVAAGVLWYFLYVRPRSSRESALVYMVKKVVSRDIYRAGLEDELRQIAEQRDEIVHDRFDFLVKDCEILDLPGPTSADKVFARVADMLAGRLGMDRDALLEKLRAREKASSTVIQPGLAIPHIIVDGHRLFEILLVRCREGIVFHPDKPYVKTAFILVGSPDERNYHLRALMTIAQLVQEHGFIDRWLAADGPENLRDIILLSGRQRDHTD